MLPHNRTSQTKQETAETKQETADTRQETESKQKTAETKQQTAETKQESTGTKQERTETNQESAETKQDTVENKQEAVENKQLTAETNQEKAETKQESRNQHKHRKSTPATLNPHAPNKHVAISVCCPQAVLNVRAKPSEAVNYQLDVMKEAVGEDGRCQVRALGSDRPYEVDTREKYIAFPNTECIFGDPIHIWMKIDKATGCAAKTLAALLKRCVVKFKQGTSDRTPY